jgi:hypothetical protein
MILQGKRFHGRKSTAVFDEMKDSGDKYSIWKDLAAADKKK